MGLFLFAIDLFLAFLFLGGLMFLFLFLHR